MLRLPFLRASRPLYLIIVILSFALVVNLLSSGASNFIPSYGQGIDARVGWSSDAYDSDGDREDLAQKAGHALAGFGDRIGRLAGGKPPARPKGKQDSASSGFRSIFQRAGGSLYELATSSSTGLFDARTPLDKLRLTSTRFVSAPAPAPYAVFAESTKREHIIVTGGFSWLGRSLVRDLLLLGDNNGAEEQTAVTSLRDGMGFADWWRGDGDADGDGIDEQAARLAKSLEGKKGIIVTLLDTEDRRVELDDMLQHAPLYHRSRVGFSLPVEDRESDTFFDDDSVFGPSRSKEDPATPPLEFIDPRSAAFSSSQVSLANFVAKGRLRIVKGDVRNTTLLASLLNPLSAASSGSRDKPEKSRFGIPKRPHHDTDEAKILPPISGVFHLAGYENRACRLANPRDCADLERNGVKSMTAALQQTPEASRPWLVLADRGNLDIPDVRSWLEESDGSEDRSVIGHQTVLPDAPVTVAAEVASEPQARKRSSTRFRPRRGAFSVSDYASPLQTVALRQKVHAITLRLPPDNHIFGDSFASRRESPVAHLIHNAVGHSPIVIGEDTFPNMRIPTHFTTSPDPSVVDDSSGGDRTSSIWQNEGLIYGDDIIETMLAAGELLARSNSAEYLRRLSIIADIDVAPPKSASTGGTALRLQHTSIAQEAVDWVIQLTKSSSPVGLLRQTPPLSEGAELSGQPIDRISARRILGTTPSTPLPLALKAYIRSLLGRQTTYLSGQIGQACAPPPDLRVLNDALAHLHMCSVQVLALVSAENIALACNPKYADDRTQSPLVLREPYADGLSQVKLKARWGPIGRVDVGFFCPFGKNGADEQVFWTESTKAVVGQWATASAQEQMAAEDPTLWTYDRFEVNFVRRDTRSFTISIPQYPQANADSPKRRMVFTIDHSKKGADGGMKEMMLLNWQLLAETGAEWQTVEWRLNPISCTRKDFTTPKGFTFMREDPLYTSQILFPSPDGSTTIADSTYATQTCRELRSAHVYMQKLGAWNEKTHTDRSCPRAMSEGSDWYMHDLPICSTDCNAPIACLVTDKCRCAKSACGDEALSGSRSPTSNQGSTDLTYNYSKSAGVEVAQVKSVTVPAKPSLHEQVEHLPWDVVIQPSARELFSRPLSTLPKVHVVELPHDIDDHMDDPACYELAKAEVPTMADHFLVQGLQQRAVAVEDADFAVIPYYQGCYYNYLKQNTYKKLADTVAYAETQITFNDVLKASNIVVPFLHDWGSCTGWWSEVEEVLPRTAPPPMSKAISWQVNGDMNTRCVKAERDVIVPAATKHAPELLARYADVRKVTPSSERKHLAFFKGDIKGFGSIARRRLETAAARSKKEGTSFLYQEYAPGGDYLTTLGQSTFCILPRGIAGWSSRAFDAIYAGCIPVFIADRTSHPFATILSYSAFSLSVAENAIHHLYDTMTAISVDEIDRMQVALLKIRDAFIYVSNPAEEWKRRGPVFFALVSMAEKLALEWPTLPAQESCRN